MKRTWYCVRDFASTFTRIVADQRSFPNLTRRYQSRNKRNWMYRNEKCNRSFDRSSIVRNSFGLCLVKVTLEFDKFRGARRGRDTAPPTFALSISISRYQLREIARECIEIQRKCTDMCTVHVIRARYVCVSRRWKLDTILQRQWNVVESLWKSEKKEVTSLLENRGRTLVTIRKTAPSALTLGRYRNEKRAYNVILRASTLVNWRGNIIN